MTKQLNAITRSLDAMMAMMGVKTNLHDFFHIKTTTEKRADEIGDALNHQPKGSK